MVGHFHNGLDLLTAKDIERTPLTTDRLQLHRDRVVVPLSCAAQPVVTVLLDPWIDGLDARLGVNDPRVRRTGTPRHLEGRAGQSIG